MGRPRHSQPPVPPSFVAECFAIRQDGVLIWRERPVTHFPDRADDRSRFNRQRAGEPAGFRGPRGVVLVRLQYDGKTRRLAALRAAWVVATSAYPDGVARARDGDERDARPENLIVTKHGRDPFGAITGKHSKGGKASALHEPPRQSCAPEGCRNSACEQDRMGFEVRPCSPKNSAAAVCGRTLSMLPCFNEGGVWPSGRECRADEAAGNKRSGAK